MPTYAYATVADLRGYLDQVKQSSEAETLLRACLARARGSIDAELRARFFAVDVDTGAAQTSYGAAAARVVRVAPASLHFILPPYQEGSITAVRTGEGTLLASTDWAEDWGAGKFALRSLANPYSVSLSAASGGWGFSAYTVTAAWGMGPAPDAIVEINIELAVNIWRTRAKGGFSELGGGQAGAVIRAVAGLNEEHRRVIARVRRDYQLIGGP